MRTALGVVAVLLGCWLLTAAWLWVALLPFRILARLIGA